MLGIRKAVQGMGLGLMMAGAVQAHAAPNEQGIPSMEDLVLAKSKVDNMISLCTQLLEAYQRGGWDNGSGGTWGGSSGEGSGNGSGGGWSTGWNLGSRVASPVAEEPENDQAASFALVGLGSGLNVLGQLVEQATLSYNTPAFFVHRNQACVKANFLMAGAQGGRVTAAIPFTNIITPEYFSDTEQEIVAVKDLLVCF